jgi:hypothetical protein
VRLSFALGGEIVVGKPDWLRSIEEEQSRQLIKSGQANEISASHQRILSDIAPTLWDKIKQDVVETIKNTDLRGIRFTAEIQKNDSIMISIFRLPSALAIQVVIISFVPDKCKFEMADSSGRGPSIEVFYGVVNGKIALSGDNEKIQSNEVTGLVEIVCQRLLEPLIREYA